MCGIYGIVTVQDSKARARFTDLLPSVTQLFQASLSRGSESAGLLTISANEVNIIKTDYNVRKFLQSPLLIKLKSRVSNQTIEAVIGHTRMATHGSAENNHNNQPVVSQLKKVIAVHNGLITNYPSFCSDPQHVPTLDTQALVDYIESKTAAMTSNRQLERFFSQLGKKMEGVANLAIFFPEKHKIALYSNNGSLYWWQQNKTFYFTSELSTLRQIFAVQPKQIKNQSLIIGLPSQKNIYQINDLSIERRFTSNHKKHFINKIEILRKHRINEQVIGQIRRCSECILPETTPFIHFNKEGVCNYCLEHSKIQQLGRDKLETILKKYRKNNGEADCLVAFSGGRDSSYGLHLLKTELNMHPIAFTYDWGMISDLGRRNQSRVLAKLGVEQILVSANIGQKRQHIRQNILAWLKRPDLGMVPLFMQGDKQCEYYADQVRRKYQIPLMIYCRGNELEKEEFKAGYCGIKEADPGGVIHNLSLKNKIKLLTYYGKQYLLNPSYINSSIFDTAFGFFSTYLKPNNYLYLWHYLPWEEQKIVKTLTQEYNWELSTDTSTSWRIGDGTPAFYNYIYYQVQGFTENDSLRARQVREGLISRAQALTLIRQENQPQYHNLKWYFDTLDLDGDMVLTVVDKMKKRYKSPYET